MKAEYNEKPDKITYKLLPDGEADVWLCKDITWEEKDNDEGEPYVIWYADEVYFRAKITLAEVEENFDYLFEHGGPTEDPDTGDPVTDGNTLADRVALLEARALALEEEVEALETWHDEVLKKEIDPDDQKDL